MRSATDGVELMQQMGHVGCKARRALIKAFSLSLFKMPSKTCQGGESCIARVMLSCVLCIQHATDQITGCKLERQVTGFGVRCDLRKDAGSTEDRAHNVFHIDILVHLEVAALQQKEQAKETCA